MLCVAAAVLCIGIVSEVNALNAQASLNPELPGGVTGKKGGESKSKDEEIIGVDVHPIPKVKPVGMLKHFERTAICDDFVMEGEVKGQIEIEREHVLAYMQEHVRQSLMQQQMNGAIPPVTTMTDSNDGVGSKRHMMLVELEAMVKWGCPVDDPRILLLKSRADRIIDDLLKEWRKSKLPLDLHGGKEFVALLLGEYLCVQEVFHLAFKEAGKDKAKSDPDARAAAKKLGELKASVDEALEALEKLQFVNRSVIGWGSDSGTPNEVAIVMCGLLAAHRMGHRLSPKTLEFLNTLFSRSYAGHKGWREVADPNIAKVKIVWRPPVGGKTHPKANADGLVEMQVQPIGWSQRIRARALPNRAPSEDEPFIDAAATGATMMTALACRHLLKEHGRNPYAKVDEQEFRDAVWSGLAAMSMILKWHYGGDLSKETNAPDLSIVWKWYSELAYATGNHVMVDVEWYPLAVRNAVRNWHGAATVMLDQLETPLEREGKDRTHPDRVAVIRSHFTSPSFRLNTNGPTPWDKRAILMLQGESLARPKGPAPARTGKPEEPKPEKPKSGTPESREKEGEGKASEGKTAEGKDGDGKGSPKGDEGKEAPKAGGGSDGKSSDGKAGESKGADGGSPPKPPEPNGEQPRDPKRERDPMPPRKRDPMPPRKLSRYVEESTGYESRECSNARE